MTDDAIQLVRRDLSQSIRELADELDRHKKLAYDNEQANIEIFFDCRMAYIEDQFAALMEMARLKLAS